MKITFEKVWGFFPTWTAIHLSSGNECSLCESQVLYTNRVLFKRVSDFITEELVQKDGFI